MLGFTLSKMNMLILVTALFIIIVFFMNSLTSIVVGQAADRDVSSYIGEVANVVNAHGLCYKTNMTVKDFLEYFGGATSSPKMFPYIMKISKVENPDPTKPSSIIMAIAGRESPDKFLAARQADLDAKIKIYNWNPDGDTLTESDEGYTIIDPQAFPPINSFTIIVDVFRDKKYVHIIPCSTKGGGAIVGGKICETNAKRLGCCLERERNAKSACVPTPSTEEVQCSELLANVTCRGA